MPAKVSLKTRPRVTAGFAKDVELVNQYAAPIQAATTTGAASARPVRPTANTTATNPVVATTSASHRFAPLRAVLDSCKRLRSNMPLASRAPVTPPPSCAAT